MASSLASMACKTRASALAASTMAEVTSSVLADGFSQADCWGISGISRAVVRRAGKDNLSLEFRQSLVDWMGADFRCDGSKEIALVLTCPVFWTGPSERLRHGGYPG